jgi:hypothetical protein
MPTLDDVRKLSDIWEARVGRLKARNAHIKTGDFTQPVKVCIDELRRLLNGESIEEATAGGYPDADITQLRRDANETS